MGNVDHERAERPDRQDRPDRPDRSERPRRFEAPSGKGMTALIWANFGLLVSVLFLSGMFYQRVVDLEARVKAQQNTDTLAMQIQDLKGEVARLRDRLDKILDGQRSDRGDRNDRGDRSR